MRNWIVAVVALALGGTVSGALIVFANPARTQVEAFAVTRAVASGSAITADMLRLQPVSIPDGTDELFTASDEARLVGARAGHDLNPGQLLQRADLLAPGVEADQRLVFLPVKDTPPAAPGSRLDLLLVGGPPDRPTVTPFALGVEVRAVVTGGFVVAVQSSRVSAFVYAAEVMRLVAVVASPGAGAGAEVPVNAPDQAMAIAAEP
jgi:hypothetical protein